MPTRALLVVAGWLMLLPSGHLLAADQRRAPDLVIFSGNVVTVDPQRPRAEALAIRGDRILAVGSRAEITALADAKTKRVDLQGKLVIPGFIEGHGHFLSLGFAQMTLDLGDAADWEEVVERVRQAARNKAPGQWIVGRGWHQAKWKRKPMPHRDGYPFHTKLSAATPRNPVLLTHASGHMSLANAEAMRLAGVTAATPDPRGGEILRDDRKRPLGVFRETAQSLIDRAYSRSRARRSPADRRQESAEATELAIQACLRHGVTSFQDAGSSFATIDYLKQWADRGRLGVRLWIMVRENNTRLAARLARYRTIGYANHRLTVRAIKRSIDGALGPHGAWLLEPYDDLPSSTGLNTATLSSLRETARLAVRHDYQLCVHAIGDQANRVTLDIFEQSFSGPAASAHKRWRVEHAQHLHPEDIPRFARGGFIASMQGIHCTSDAVFVMQRLGQRRAALGAYAWRRLLDSGAIVINGTDAPVEDIDPLASFYASVTRKLKNGTTFFPEQRMTRAEALESYTASAAYAAFEEDLKGSLTAGKLADLVVLSHDILTCPDEQLLKARVLRTMVGGKWVYTVKPPR